jgi:hypothetical protein
VADRRRRKRKDLKPAAPEAASIPKRKRPVAVESVTPPVGTVVIRFGQLDLQGPWCLTRITRAHHLDLLQRLRSIETMTIDEMKQNKVWKDYSIPHLPSREARQRLTEIGRDDETTISRLQISGARRLYGFRKDNNFFALWWDPDHQIWPGSK